MAQEHSKRLDLDLATNRNILDAEGYIVFPGVVDKALLQAHTERLYAEFDALNENGPLFDGGGGMIMGHLNCFPGAESRFFYEALESSGILSLVRQLFPEATRLPNVGCNFNLPGSSAQNFHIDGYFDTPFPVINVASVNTTLVNGALNVLARTHRRSYKYWQIVMERPPSLRLPLSQGDVVVRTSTLWHRGTENRSSRARPMLALSWEDGGSTVDDPYAKNGGKIAFYPNRYTTDLVGRLREHAYVHAPGLNEAVRFVQSVVK